MSGKDGFFLGVGLLIGGGLLLGIFYLESLESVLLSGV